MTEKNVAEKSFRFSVVVAVYNAEEHLAETIDSLVNQTFSFEENVQVILVDDGSTDGSLAICEDYQKRYPHNIEVHAKENGGVSSARNLGIKYATGEFVNFLDSDDLWAPDAFEVMDSFLVAHPDVKLAAARIKHIGRWTSYHALDYKFEKTRVVNIFADWDTPQLSSSSAFFSADLLDNRSFPPIPISEDFYLTSSLIAELGAYGLVREAEYYYRKPETLDSAIDSSRKNPAFYRDTVQLCYRGLFDRSRHFYGFVIRYIQNAVMYDLQWRISARQDGYLTAAELEAYRKDVVSLLWEIDDEVILGQHHLSSRKKIEALAMKKSISYDALVERLAITGASDTPLYKKVFKRALTIESIDITDTEIVFEGFSDSVLYPKLASICATDKKDYFWAEPFLRPEHSESTYFNSGFASRSGFRLRVPRGKSKTITFRLVNAFDAGSGIMSLSYGRYGRLTNAAPSSYYYNDHCAIVSRAGHALRIMERPTWYRLLKREVSFDRRIADCQFGGWGVVGKRLIAIVDKWLHRKKAVCLVSDRLGKADDNGEYFFRWLVDHANDEVVPYFVISKSSSDYERMKKLGRVVDPASQKYERLFLRAKYIVSSSFDNHVIHHFKEQEVFFRGLYDFRFVFLQHGVIKDDMSRSLGKYIKNISLFVCSAEPERDSILGHPYYYDDSRVILTGLPRHDRLRDLNYDVEKIILVAPTWRNSLVLGFDAETDRPIIPEKTFLGSTYYKSYDSLLRDERLRAALKEYGYTLDFAIHPGFSECSHLFTGSDVVNILDDCSYNREIERAAIMVTDFSSICFDFALEKKPVVYFQFDEETFFSGGHCFDKGYFDYRRDGFGPVLNDVDAVVDYLIDRMKNEARMEKRFEERADSFFFRPPVGESSCSLVYESMIEGGIGC